MLWAGGMLYVAGDTTSCIVHITDGTIPFYVICLRARQNKKVQEDML